MARWPCFFTVSGVMFSVSAMAWIDMPAANESMTSNSRSVSTALTEV